MEQKLKIGIVGVGAIGTVVALLLKDKGYDVEITKKNTMGLIIDNCVNLEINGAFGDRSYLVPFRQNNTFSGQKDVLIILTQSYAVESAYGDVEKYLSPNGVVVTPQNVLSFEGLKDVLPKDRFVPIVIDFTATRIDENHVKVLHDGSIHLGTYTDASSVYVPFLNDIFSCVTKVELEENMPSFVISRFMLNNAISSICAITGYNLGKTLEYKTAKKLFLGIISEEVEVFKKLGIKIVPYYDTFDYEQFVEKSFAGLRYRGKMFNRLIKQNGDTVSSLLRALENKQPTEIDCMTGMVVNLADKLNIDVPFNRTVTEFLKDVEEGKRGIYIENLEDEIFKKLEI